MVIYYVNSFSCFTALISSLIYAQSQKIISVGAHKQGVPNISTLIYQHDYTERRSCWTTVLSQQR